MSQAWIDNMIAKGRLQDRGTVNYMGALASRVGELLASHDWLLVEMVDTDATSRHRVTVADNVILASVAGWSEPRKLE